MADSPSFDPYPYTKIIVPQSSHVFGRPYVGKDLPPLEERANNNSKCVPTFSAIASWWMGEDTVGRRHSWKKNLISFYELARVSETPASGDIKYLSNSLSEIFQRNNGNCAGNRERN